MNNFTFSTPRICDCGGDLSKQWYIYFRAKDESTGDIKQFRYKLGINRFKKKRERQEAAKAALATVIIRVYNEVNVPVCLVIKGFDFIKVTIFFVKRFKNDNKSFISRLLENKNTV